MQLSPLLFPALLVAAVAAADPGLVAVQIYAESGCPFCQHTIVQAVPAMLNAPGLQDIVDISLYPWGNAYYGTDACGKGPYSSTERQCWYKRCVNTSEAPGDCFDAGSLVPQHGAIERTINRIEACAIKHNPEWKTHWPFIRCMEARYSVRAAGRCAAVAGLDASVIAACTNGDEGKAVEVSMAKATPYHLGVPYVLVDGKPLDNPRTLVSAVCAAYGGVKPAGCSGALRLALREYAVLV